MAKIIQALTFNLAAPIDATQTSIAVRNLKDSRGTPITSLAGTTVFATIEPRSNSNQEIISFTGITNNGNGIVTLTGVTRNLNPQEPYTTLGGLVPHGNNAECILSNNPPFYNDFIRVDSNVVITGSFQFPTPTLPSNPATKAYVDGISFAGAPDATATSKGVVRLTTSPNVTLGNPTITIASPAVISLTAHGLSADDTVVFSTTGALPTGILPSVPYYVLAAGLGADDFRISDTAGGAAINTTGSQSGTHTVVRTTPRAVAETDSRLPTQSENDAMVGNQGTPSSTNKFVTEEGAISATATFGDGSDGEIVLDGTNTFAFLSKSGSVYTMTRDIYANNLTINSGSTLEPAGFRIFVKETFGGAGTVRYNGNNGNANAGQTGGTGGTALSTTGFFKNIAGGNATNGAASGATASTAAAGTSTNPSIGVSGKRGGRGAGRNDAANTTPTAGTATAPVLKYPTMRSLVIACLDLNNSGVLSQLLGTAGSSGGSGGHGYIVSNGIGGGGGGGGATGGTIFLACKIFAGTVTFQVIGGNGGNAAAIGGNGGNGGGGAGGSGGVVIVIYGVKTATPTYTLTGGTGGTVVANGQSPNINEAGGNGNTGVNYEIPIKNLL